MKRLLIKWHRRVGLFILIPLLMFSLSGLLHPLMRLAAAPIAQRALPQEPWQQVGALDATLQSDALPSIVSGIRPVQLDGQAILQVWHSPSKASSFWDAQGHRIPDGAREYAVQSARVYAGEPKAQVESVTLITQFSDQYQRIHRMLPVFEVRFDREDGLTAYVDIRHDRLVALENQTRRNLMGWFRALHTWSFLQPDSPLRTPLLLGLSGLCGVMGLSGLYLYGVLPIRKRKKAKLAKTHVYTGVFISVALLMFSSSGLIKTWEKQTPDQRGIRVDQPVQRADIQIGFAALKAQFPDITNAVIHTLGSEPVWQIMMGRAPGQWVSAVDGRVLPGLDRHFALSLVSAAKVNVDKQITTQWVTRFNQHPDYGFIDKRLPVMALEDGTHTVFVDVRDAVISVVAHKEDRWFTWVFRYLHKWRFLDGLGKNGRDAVMAVFILGVASTALLGGVMWVRRQSKKKRPLSL
jgi:uncharacterized iron-regulated membrane protein